MKLRHGRFGAFLGCTGYPECKGIVNIPKKGEAAIDQGDMPPCPALECPGHMNARKSRFGKTFYSCSTFPECDVIVNDLAQLDTKYVNHPRKGRFGKKTMAKETPVDKKTATKKTATKKTTTKAKAPKEAAAKKPRKMPDVHLSKDLANVIGNDTMPRGEVLKKLWDYIRANDLQDPANKRSIRPDAKLAKVFGTKDPVDMFKMTGLLSAHMGKEAPT
jgi:DNA topoisomerase-1